MMGVMQGLRYTFRQLAKSPVFNRRFYPHNRAGDRSQHPPIFSVMDAVLLHFLSSGRRSAAARLFPSEEPASEHLADGYGDMSMSLPVFEAMRTRQEGFHHPPTSSVLAPLALKK